MLLAAASDVQHVFGFHMDIHRMVWGANDNQIYRLAKNHTETEPWLSASFVANGLPRMRGL